MKFKVELEEGETPEQADELLEKAVQTKIKSRQEYNSERYPDEALEDLHQMVMDQHHETLKDALEQVKNTVSHHIKGY